MRVGFLYRAGDDTGQVSTVGVVDCYIGKYADYGSVFAGPGFTPD